MQGKLWQISHFGCHLSELLDRKTTIMKRVIGEDHHEISPTVGFNIKTLEFQSYILNMWDIGGQKSIRTYWRNYFEQTDGIIWVVDSVDRFRMEECRDQLREILMQEVMQRLSSSDLRCSFPSCE